MKEDHRRILKDKQGKGILSRKKRRRKSQKVKRVKELKRKKKKKIKNPEIKK